MKLYLIMFPSYNDPELFGPFGTDEERIEEAKEMFDAEHCVCRLNIDEQGNPSVYTFVNSEIEE